VTLSYIVLIVGFVFAGLGLFPWGPPPAKPWTPYLWPASWFCFMLFMVLTHGAGINLHG
jgi:hypothetical protein